MSAALKLVLLAPNIDVSDVGEAHVAARWAEALSERVDLTVLAFQRPGRPPLATQLPKAEVVTWPEPTFLLRAERLNAMLKPGYPLLLRHVRRWMRDQAARGRRFDIAHQIMPLAARYPSPFCGLGVPYVLGPVGGTLPTPPGFVGEMGSAPWFTRLRALDAWRFRRDPWLRRTYADADLVLGVAPYIREALADIPLKRFEPMLELGIDALPPERPVRAGTGLGGAGLRLLHVGRAVRTKGLRDVIRALAQLSDLPDVTLTAIGDGEDLPRARDEAAALGVADRVTFCGRQPKEAVMAAYADADLFTFPSFREPTGGVLYEAMQMGLPIITTDYGGPAFITDQACAIRLPLSTPEALARDIAAAIRNLYHDPDRRAAMGAASRTRVAAEGLWPRKIDRLLGLYDEVLAARPDRNET